MRILFLAPQPFFEERGTPIAVDRLLRELSSRGESVDLVTYHQGADVRYPNVWHLRAAGLPFARRVRPGFSWKKVAYDLAMLPVVARLVLHRRYDLVHAVEESVFVALALKALFRLPYVYDMDSSLSQQIGEKYPSARPLTGALAALETLAVRHAQAVVPVCDALARRVAPARPRRVTILPDVSLLQPIPAGRVEDLRGTLRIDGPLVLYVGNLERYQGIDLLLESFALAAPRAPQAHLVVIGGEPADIARYTLKAAALGIADRIHLCGPRPVDQLAGYLDQADVLVSPRTKGANTPMKIYSYLDSGKPVLATDLDTHTQVLSDQVAMLARPEPTDFARALLTLLADAPLRRKLGEAGRQLVRDDYSPAAFHLKVNRLYDQLRDELAPGPLPAAVPVDATGHKEVT